MDTFKKTDSEIRPALTSLSDEEQMFREAVRDFATSEIAPLVSQMDRRQELDAGLLPQLFELGLMGIEIPEEFGGAGSNFFTSVLRGGGDVEDRSVRSHLGRCPEHAGHQRTQ